MMAGAETGAAAAAPNIAAPTVGLAKVAIGNNQTEHGFGLLPTAWTGKPDFFSQNMVADQRVLRLLGLFGESGAVLGNLCEFEWDVGKGPLFVHTDPGPQWNSIVMSPKHQNALLSAVCAEPKHAFDLCDDDDDDDRRVPVTTKKQRAAKDLLALQAGANSSTADTASGGGGGGGDVGRSERAAKRNRTDEDAAQMRAAVEAADAADMEEAIQASQEGEGSGGSSGGSGGGPHSIKFRQGHSTG